MADLIATDLDVNGSRSVRDATATATAGTGAGFSARRATGIRGSGTGTPFNGLACGIMPLAVGASPGNRCRSS